MLTRPFPASGFPVFSLPASGIPASTWLLLPALLLSGCAMGGPNGGSTTAALTLQGHIKGGQQPVSSSVIQLYEASETGYGTASAPQIMSTVTTDSSGAFNITGLYNCSSATAQVYIVAKGGNPGLTAPVAASRPDTAAVHANAVTINNGSLTLMAALGPCGNLSSSTNVNVDEVTTVAAVWALAPFMTAYDHVATSSTNVVGLTNAFGMAANLASFATGLSPGDAPAGSTIPSPELNALANVLAGCVNTAGGTAGDGSACGNLFTAATPPGGTAPTDTIGAALNIALNPGRHVSDIFILGAPTGPFQPTLGTAPNDWTVAVNFAVGPRTTSDIAFDASGNLWVAAPDALYELSPQGVALQNFPSMAGNKVAIDADGNIWVSTALATLAKMPPTLGTQVSYSAPNSLSAADDGLAIDGSGNAWYTCDNCTAIYKMDPSGNLSNANGYPVTGSNHQTNISIDSSENAWLGNFSYAEVNVFQNNGTALNGSPLACGNCLYAAFVANDHSGSAWIVGSDLTHVVPGSGYTNYDTGAGLDNPVAVAIDGAGNAWVANPTSLTGTTAGSLSELTNAGVAVSPAAAGYVSSTLATPQSIAVDGSGSVWLRNSGSSTVTAFVGAAVPVVTPLALGVKNGTLGTAP